MYVAVLTVLIICHYNVTDDVTQIANIITSVFLYASVYRFDAKAVIVLFWIYQHGFRAFVSIV